MKKKYVIITGGGSGIGQACTKLFAERDYCVLILGRNSEKLNKTQAINPQNITPYTCDLADLKSIKHFVAQIQEEIGASKIWALINNAAIFSKETFEKTSAQTWQEMMQINLLGPVELTRQLLPFMDEGSSVINISSTLGLRPTPTTSAYSASKAAMVNWSQELALELAPKIRVNTVCPGLVETPIHDFYHLNSEEKQTALQELKNLQPLGRVGHPEDIAQSVYFLSSEASSWTTGAVLSVDGGINL